MSTEEAERKCSEPHRGQLKGEQIHLLKQMSRWGRRGPLDAVTVARGEPSTRGFWEASKLRALGETLGLTDTPHVSEQQLTSVAVRETTAEICKATTFSPEELPVGVSVFISDKKGVRSGVPA